MTNLKQIEKFLKLKRGYVSKFPENKKAVIIISGGLDSTVTSARLIEDFGLELFPIHIRRGQTNGIFEERSVKYFSIFFQKRYGKKRFHEPRFIDVNIPPVEFKKDLLGYMTKFGYPLRDTIMFLLGVEYAVAVSQKCGSKIRIVYSANVLDDPFPHTTLMGMRANTLNVCVNMDDWDWQLTSPNIDSFLANYTFGKVDEIKWAIQKGIPIQKTTSCYRISKETNFLSCGSCLACKRRHTAFLEAGLTDPTEYHEMTYNWMDKIKSIYHHPRI